MKDDVVRAKAAAPWAHAVEKIAASLAGAPQEVKLAALRRAEVYGPAAVTALAERIIATEAATSNKPRLQPQSELQPGAGSSLSPPTETRAAPETPRGRPAERGGRRLGSVAPLSRE